MKIDVLMSIVSLIGYHRICPYLILRESFASIFLSKIGPVAKIIEDFSQDPHVLMLNPF